MSTVNKGVTTVSREKKSYICIETELEYVVRKKLGENTLKSTRQETQERRFSPFVGEEVGGVGR